MVDEVRGPRRDVRLAFHLGPAITADLAGNRARAHLDPGRRGPLRGARPARAAVLAAHRGESDPPLGWYSAGFGRKEPSTTLVGTGFADGAAGGASPPCSGSAARRGRVVIKRRHWALPGGTAGAGPAGGDRLR